jgi:cobalt-zinc-cadmium efflux system protein
LLADAGRNLGDVLGLSLSWWAAMLSQHQPSGRFTYGLRSSSILSAGHGQPYRFNFTCLRR